jgi:Fic family protein
LLLNRIIYDTISAVFSMLMILKKMKKNKLNKRLLKIIEIIESKDNINISKIMSTLGEETVTKVTINRDLNTLINLGYINRQGKGRSVYYEISPKYKIQKPLDIKGYFELDINKRKTKETFNFNIFELLKDNLLDKSDINYLENLNNKYQKNIKGLTETIIRKEFERLTIELSWKSSKIEGNTYSLLETEALIKQKEEASGHSEQESKMILNHKEAFDYIRLNTNNFKNITVSKIEDLHSIITKGMGIKKGLRSIPVGVTGTAYRPLDNQWQIKEALEKTCELINNKKNVFEKTILLVALVSYIQPFEDGNKRTSRLIGNAILLSNNICPLSYRSVKESEYKKAMILFYEQNNLSYFKDLFIEQFDFAVNNYFQS